MPVTLIDCDRSRAGEILVILNDAIVNSTALYDYRERTPAMMDGWFDAKEKGGFPVIGAIDDAGALLGFASYGTFRAWPAYKYSVEHSLYVDAAHRGRGLGKVLLAAIIERARVQGYHNLIAGIDAANDVSIALHRRYGFEPCGTIRHAGFKFGRWLDLQFYQRLLDTPVHPIDG
jgi:phosphinothricin acetyltransferase